MAMIISGSGTISGLAVGGLPAGTVTSTTLDSTIVPAPGTTAFFGMTSAPSGWIKANGAAVSRTTYAALFAAIGTTFGSGDGSTTFNVPDLRGYFPRGWVDNGSVDSGRTFGSSQAASVGTHGHPFAGAVQGSGSSGNWVSNVPAVSQSTDADPGDVRPKNVALLACIKY